VLKPSLLKINMDAVQLKVKNISVGAYHVLAVTTEGISYGWGRNEFGQLAIGKSYSTILRPVRIQYLSERRIVMAAAGETHSLFLSELGEVYSAGYNEFGELGIGAPATLAHQEED
jgi:alpha-tubulin suppressor-like RCC1 family protein